MTHSLKIIAGLNGSGKSTFAEACLSSSDKFINPDLIAMGLGSDFEKASFHAGKILLADIKNKISRKESFSFESTLSGITYLSIIEYAKINQYKIVIYFLTLGDIQLNLQRIQSRVSMGGHNIPVETVKRRALKCNENFWNKYRPMVDEWYIINNESTEPKILMDYQKFELLNPEEKKNFIDNFLTINRDIYE